MTLNLDSVSAFEVSASDMALEGLLATWDPHAEGNELLRFARTILIIGSLELQFRESMHL